MAKVVAFLIARPLFEPAAIVRAMVVAGCSLALILAGPGLPPLGL